MSPGVIGMCFSGRLNSSLSGISENWTVSHYFIQQTDLIHFETQEADIFRIQRQDEHPVSSEELWMIQ